MNILHFPFINKILKDILRTNTPERVNSNDGGFFGKRRYKDHVGRYRFAKKWAKEKVVLDIACGSGYGSKILSEVAKDVVGVDIDFQEIKKAKREYPKLSFPEISFICSDANEFLSSNKSKFDLIVCFETIEHLKNYQRFILLLKKNLKKSGILLLSSPDKNIVDALALDKFNDYHFKEFYKEELFRLLTKVFGNPPKVYRQRPFKKQLLLSFLISYTLDTNSIIVPDNQKISGMVNIFEVRN